MAVNPSEGLIKLLTYDPELKGFLKGLLLGEGYTCESSENEKTFIDEVNETEYDLLIIDFEDTPVIDICKKIRGNFNLRHIPIIVLVQKEHTIDKIKVIYAGADDYVEKPILASDILTRVKANLWRAKRDLDANPLTRLPGNVSILKDMEKRIRNNDTFAVGYVDLNKFKEYNDYYGFEFGDRVIKRTAEILTKALYECGSEADFLGHIGGDDFIFITPVDQLAKVCDKIVSDFDSAVSDFYKAEDLQKGYIVVKNRVGKLTSIPLLSVSIGVATNKEREFTHVGQVIQVATELKSYAKTFGKSIYVVDQRHVTS